ncbi:MAG: class B sortase [Bacilli bacterium]|nr:class B sortase [Bacilli bacterium]
MTKKKIKKVDQRRRIIFLLLLIVVIGSVFGFIFFFFKPSKKPYYAPLSKVNQVRTTIVEDSETLGWINVQGTDIDYPVVYETNQVYLGLKDYLWLSNRYIEGNNRVAIFGHNIKNVSNQPLIAEEGHVRFEQLLSFVYYDFAKENLYVQYTHDGKDELYKIYAAGFYDKTEEQGQFLSDKKETEEYIKAAQENSIYEYGVSVNSKDSLISLVTCTRFFGSDGKTTFRIDARKVRSGEKINKYSVQKSKNYDILNIE